MSRRFWVGIVAVALIAVGSVVAGLLVYLNDHDDFHQMQRDEAIRAAHQMEAVAKLSIAQLTSAAAFFKVEEDLSEHEFRVVGRSLLQRGALSGTAYIPRVPASQRDLFKRRHNLEVLEGNPILGFRPARRRPVHFPITFAAAEQSTPEALGYDLAQDPQRLAFLHRARDSAGPVSSPVVPLLIGGSGINVYRAIYRDGAPTETRAQRRRALVGFAAGAFRIEDLSAAATAGVPPSAKVQLRVAGRLVSGPQDALGDATTTRLRIADRTWLLTVKTPGGPGLSLPLAIAVLGISLAALLGSLIVTWSRRERMQELTRQASEDALTGLDNRRRFEKDLAAAMARSRREGSTGALLMLDLDEFKRVNDSLGHPAGDRLIKEVAGVLRGRAREGDTLARLGGDEFAVILPRCSRQEARVAAEAIRTEIREHRWDGPPEPVTVSIGVAMFGDDPRTSVATVVSEADAAMYAAKDEGRDAVKLFNPVSVREGLSRQT